MGKIRVWKLGSLEHNIMPTDKTIGKLAEILQKNNGTLTDLIWGPEIDVQVVEEGELDIIAVPDPENEQWLQRIKIYQDNQKDESHG